MRTTFVVAASRNGVIGRDGGLPWKLSSDLKMFRRLTLGRPVIMGRRTWESLGIQPLPDRHNIVITRQPGYHAEGALVVHSLTAALAAARRLAEQDGAEEIAIIGGGQVFAEALAAGVVDRIYLSEVDLEVAGDTMMPAIDRAKWRQTARQEMPRGPRDEAGFNGYSARASRRDRARRACDGAGQTAMQHGRRSQRLLVMANDRRPQMLVRGQADAVQGAACVGR